MLTLALDLDHQKLAKTLKAMVYGRVSTSQTNIRNIFTWIPLTTVNKVKKLPCGM